MSAAGHLPILRWLQARRAALRGTRNGGFRVCTGKKRTFAPSKQHFRVQPSGVVSSKASVRAGSDRRLRVYPGQGFTSVAAMASAARSRSLLSGAARSARIQVGKLSIRSEIRSRSIANSRT
jgi:hypothetical protein